MHGENRLHNIIGMTLRVDAPGHRQAHQFKPRGALAAAAQGLDPLVYCDRMEEKFRAAWPRKMVLKGVMHPADAERAARAILAVDTRSVSGTMALAQALGQSRRYKDVIETVERFAAASGPNENLAPLLSFLSTAYQALGQHTQAIDALTRAKVADPDDEMMDLYLVQAYLSARRFTTRSAKSRP